MPQRDKMETSSKKLKISIMAHKEDEEMQHDISKLRDQVQQISLSQKVTKANMDNLKNGIEAKINGLKNGMEAKINDKEEKLKGNMEDFKKDMEGLKEFLKNLLQERLPNGENVVEETHDENKRNVNHDFIESNIGLKTHHIPKIYMMNFDGKDLVAWIL